MGKHGEFPTGLRRNSPYFYLKDFLDLVDCRDYFFQRMRKFRKKRNAWITRWIRKNEHAPNAIEDAFPWFEVDDEGRPVNFFTAEFDLWDNMDDTWKDMIEWSNRQKFKKVEE